VIKSLGNSASSAAAQARSRASSGSSAFLHGLSQSYSSEPSSEDSSLRTHTTPHVNRTRNFFSRLNLRTRQLSAVVRERHGRASISYSTSRAFHHELTSKRFQVDASLQFSPMCLDLIPIVREIVLFRLMRALESKCSDGSEVMRFETFGHTSPEHRNFVNGCSTKAGICQIFSDTRLILSQGDKKFDTAIDASPGAVDMRLFWTRRPVG